MVCPAEARDHHERQQTGLTEVNSTASGQRAPNAWLGLKRPEFGGGLYETRGGSHGNFGYCQWTSDGSSRTTYRRLYLTVELTQMREEGLAPTETTTFGTLAADWIDDVERVPVAFQGQGPRVKVTPLAAAVDKTRLARGEVNLVKGLGNDAVAVNDQWSGAAVTFRVGNTVASISYREEAIRRAPGKEQMDAAVRVASDSARALGMPPRATPQIVPQVRTDGTPKSPPDACTLVPAAVMERALGGKPTSQPPSEQNGNVTNSKADPNARRQDEDDTGCVWKANGRAMRVVIRMVPDSARDTGTHLATREYLMMHLNARAEQPLTRSGEKYFTALKGPGDQAFGSYAEGSTPARVLFRSGAVLAEVTYGHLDASEPSDGKRAVGLAYDIAAQVQKGLRG